MANWSHLHLNNIIFCRYFSIEVKAPVDEKSDTTDATDVADKAWTDVDKDLVEENPNEIIVQEDEDEDSTIASER